MKDIVADCVVLARATAQSVTRAEQKLVTAAAEALAIARGEDPRL